MQPGERVALVGATNAGKTTLAKLIAGVHNPTTGQIRIGGVAVATLDPAASRAAVVLVTQEVHTFAGALADDLRLARPGAPEADLVAALDKVGALAWARALPDGLATVVGAGGHRLTQAATADRIVVLDAGRVVETGPHAELATGEGPYARLWAAWSRARTTAG